MLALNRGGMSSEEVAFVGRMDVAFHHCAAGRWLQLSQRAVVVGDGRDYRLRSGLAGASRELHRQQVLAQRRRRGRTAPVERSAAKILDLRGRGDRADGGPPTGK